MNARTTNGQRYTKQCGNCLLFFEAPPGTPCFECGSTKLYGEPDESSANDQGNNDDPLDYASRIMTVAELRSLTPPTAMIPTLADLDSLVVLYGPPGAGKSLLALDVACRIASGTRWHGQQLVEFGPVLLVAAEGAHGTPSRIDAWKEATGTMNDPGSLVFLPEPVNLLSEGSVSAFCAYVAKLRPTLVIIDTLARCMVGGDENSSKDMGLAIAALDRIRRAAGCCVIAVHHSGKDRSAGARGSSALLGAADTMLSISVDNNVLTITPEKQKHHPVGNPQRFQMVTYGNSVALVSYDGVTRDMITDKTRDALAALASIATPEGVSWTDWKTAAKEADVSQTSVSTARKNCFDQGLIGLGTTSTKRYPRYVVSADGFQFLNGTTGQPGSAPDQEF